MTPSPPPRTEDNLLCRGALFSPCRTYRYALWRIWDETAPFALFVGLNPSTADETRDDPTIRRCLGFARAGGYGGVYVANLFAFRATRPADLKAAPAPVGPENDVHLRRLLSEAGIVLAAWGVHGSHLARDREVLALFSRWHCLGRTAAGHPRHPLYLRSDCAPEPLGI